MITTLEHFLRLRPRIEGPLVATSGGFDPLHVGHLRSLVAARELGRTLLVIANADRYLLAKKGYVFMPHAERMEILDALRCVDFVLPFDDGTPTVSAAVRAIRPEVFAKGISLPDPTLLPEWESCREVGCRVVLDVGGGKTRSSSEMVERAAALHTKRLP
jgi:D-beta-D-heptose 7-phosphate kinase/D-beta-D-heptose 1-phosphate adenosyltransferase